MAHYLSILSTRPTYIPFPSAFEIIEKPLRYCHDHIEPQKDRQAPSNQDCLMYLGAMIAYPIVFCAVPLTMAADIVTGIAESLLCICRGFRLSDVAQLIKKKVVISPLHHLTFVAVNLGLPSVIILAISIPVFPLSPKQRFLRSCMYLAGLCLYYFSNPLVDEADQAKALNKLPKPIRQIIHQKEVFVITNVALAVFAYWHLSSFFNPRDIASVALKYMIPALSTYWMLSYTTTQRLIGSFSSAYNHHVFSIFKDGGAKDKKDLFMRAYQDLGFSGVSLEDWDVKAENYYENYRSSYHTELPKVPHNTQSSSTNRWQRYLNDDYKNIKPETVHEASLYKEFKSRVLAGKPPIDLLGLSSIFTKEDVINAYRKYTRHVHPDRNIDKKEANALFKCLCEARYQLDLEARAEFTAHE